PEPVTKHLFRGSQVESCHAIAGIHHGLRFGLTGSTHINRQHRREAADILTYDLKGVHNDGIRLIDFIPALTFPVCPSAERFQHILVQSKPNLVRLFYRFAIPDTVTVRIPPHNCTVTRSHNYRPFAGTAAMTITRPL